MLQTNRQANRQTDGTDSKILTTPTDKVGVGNKIHIYYTTGRTKLLEAIANLSHATKPEISVMGSQ